eukprot:Em0009g461a
MAKGLAVGVKVCASSKAVIGERAAKARYGAGWKNKLAYGIINEQLLKVNLRDGCGGLVATSSSADDTANAEARDEVNEIEDGEDHLGEWEAFDADDNDGQPEIDNDGNDSEQRSENVIVCQGVEWHICDCVSDDVRIQPRFSAKLLWVDDCCAAERIPIQYFKMSFPTQMVPDILMWSGMAMPIKKKKMDEAEFWRLLGIIYTLTRTTSKSVTCGVFKMEFSLLPDLEVATASHVKGVGAELKDAACSQTQVIIALEIQEGKEEMATKKYMQEWKKKRVINADSAFASVTTAEACRSMVYISLA